MKESDYILVTNLQLLRAAERLVRDAHDDSQDAVTVVVLLRKRINELEKEIKVRA